LIQPASKPVIDETFVRSATTSAMESEEGMYTTMGFRITVAIGVLALGLAVMDQTSGWAAEPVAKDKIVKKSAQTRTSAPASNTADAKSTMPGSTGKSTACFGEAPQLDKVTPDEGKAGDKVTITGSSFGTAACLRGVSFGPGHPAQFQQTNNSITTTVPSGGKKGLVLLTVTTASGENSKPFLVK
jgi:IPT/TIG domain